MMRLAPSCAPCDPALTTLSAALTSRSRGCGEGVTAGRDTEAAAAAVAVSADTLLVTLSQSLLAGEDRRVDDAVSAELPQLLSLPWLSVGDGMWMIAAAARVT